MRKPWRSFLLFILVGVLGAAITIPMAIEMILTTLETAGIGEEISIPPAAMAAAAMINPVIIVILATAAGHLLAHSAGFTSLLYINDRFRTPIADRWIPSVKTGAVAGLLVGAILITSDLVFRPFVPSELSLLNQEFSWYKLAVSLIYGGILEEIMMRWGLMTLFVWILWKTFGRKADTPPVWAVWTGLVVSALLFGIAHYSATVAVTEMTPLVFIRMITLNGIGGVIFGWVYWKKNLESAMFAHMFAHITLNAGYIISSIVR